MVLGDRWFVVVVGYGFAGFCFELGGWVINGLLWWLGMVLLGFVLSLAAGDLSFNRLEGSVPDLRDHKKLEYMYLTSNLLSGPIPDWIMGSDDQVKYLDLSYNSFSESSDPACQDTLQNKNLFKSSSGRDNLILDECLKNVPCSKDRYSRHINCGGNAITIGNITYEADNEQGSSAKFFHGKENWGSSSTGLFWDTQASLSDYIANNVSILTMNESELYTSARLSPLSFTYYARCLAKGTYNVKLHFAEIVIRDNRSFYSLGRRIFDIYVQEKLVWKDFDIESSARGVDKAVVKEHKANVTDNVLMIRFYWAGKGTTAAPKRGTYGPLISAISVESDFSPPHDGKKKVSIVVLVGAVVVVLLIFMILGILWWKGCLGGRSSRENELKGLDLQTGFFTYRQIKAATNNFNAANKIGEGGFGSVYKGILLDGIVIAPCTYSVWPCRWLVKIGLVRKAENMCWHSKRDLNPKISDFGLAKLDEEENTHISTRIAGTIGYMAPEYALRGYLTDKADVFSFGVVALEIVAGKNNMKYQPNENFVCLLDKAIVLQQKGNLMELVDPKLGSEFSKEEVLRMIKVALLCTNPSPAPRPTMTAVVSMLEGGTVVDELNIDPSIYGNNEWRFEALRNQLGQSPQSISRENQSLAQSSNATWMGSSTSA
nr:putative lrr receptor-like serine/threonine-protein kinase [Quercus suber]